jgi:hypothetical protein
MDKFLDAYYQPKWNQRDIKHLNSPITCNKIEPVIESLPTKKSPGPDGFMNKFHQTFKEELVGNVGPKSDHMERSDLAKRFFIVGWERERAEREKQEGQGLKHPSVRLSMI